MKAFLDTTVVTDLLLKGRRVRDHVESTLQDFTPRVSHTYVMKEFLVGPFRYFIWTYNQLANSHKLSAVLHKLSRLSTTPQRYRLATALQALSEAALSRVTVSTIAKRYGPSVVLDELAGNEYRLLLKKAIFSAWRNREDVVDEWLGDQLSCLKIALTLSEKGVFEVQKLGCERHGQCSLHRSLTFDLRKLSMVHRIVSGQSGKAEYLRRARALRDILRKPNFAFGDNICRSLGDAAIAYFCPSDATLLTTNKADFEPICQALGIRIETLGVAQV